METFANVNNGSNLIDLKSICGYILKIFGGEVYFNITKRKSVTD